jgi:hypothetical protein
MTKKIMIVLALFSLEITSYASRPDASPKHDDIADSVLIQGPMFPRSVVSTDGLDFRVSHLTLPPQFKNNTQTGPSRCIPSSIEALRPDCCAWPCYLTAAFESTSRFAIMRQHAFSTCLGLVSVCIPSETETIGDCRSAPCSDEWTIEEIVLCDDTASSAPENKRSEPRVSVQ